MQESWLACVVGARPNFMKMAPLLRAITAYSHMHVVLIHTGQHYDENLSDVFFSDLGMRRPDIYLEAGSGKHGAQTARVLERMEDVLETARPVAEKYDRVVVVGDVTPRWRRPLLPPNSASPWRTLRQVCEASTGLCQKKSIGLSPIRYATFCWFPNPREQTIFAGKVTSTARFTWSGM